MSIFTNINKKSEPSTSKILTNVATNIILNKMNGSPAMSQDNIMDPATMFVDRTLEMLCKVTKEAFHEVIQEEIEQDREMIACLHAAHEISKRAAYKKEANRRYYKNF